MNKVSNVLYLNSYVHTNANDFINVHKQRKIAKKQQLIKKIQAVILLITFIAGLSAICYRNVEVKTQKQNLLNAKLVEYSVNKGDTLWSIAEKLNYNELDTREVIKYIKDVNNLSSYDLDVNDVIQIPQK